MNLIDLLREFPKLQSRVSVLMKKVNSGTTGTGTGATGATGPKGDPGAAGADGKTIRYGTTDPTTQTGVAGDFYINTTSNYIFGPKTTTWPAGISIVGPRGIQGVQGPAGITGLGTDYIGPNKPAAPTSGVQLYSKVRVGRRNVTQIDIFGVAEELQKDIARTRSGFQEVAWNNTSLSSLGISGSSITPQGTVSGIPPALTNFKTQTKRVSVANTASTAGLSAGMRFSSTRHLCRQTGFSISCRFALPDTVPNPYTFFFGTLDNVAALGGSVDPSSQINIVGLGKDAADTNLFFMFNDTSGTATKVDTGIALTNTTMYIGTVACRPGDSKFYIAIEDMETGLIYEMNTDTSIDIPAMTKYMSYQVNLGNTTSTVTATIQYGGFFGDNL